MASIDDTARLEELRRTILAKPALCRFYEEVYRNYADCLARCPPNGVVIELGSGAGFAKRVIPTLLTSDILPYAGLDQVFDATKMPFADRSVRLIAMMNVFHHIPDVGAFLFEAQRCLVPGGRVFIFDQHPGRISGPIFRHFHSEPFRPEAADWEFTSSGPLSGANGALTWIVFVRDRARFERSFPGLTLLRYQPTTPLRYWLSGGLKKWSLLPAFLWNAATLLDHGLLNLSSQFGSFVNVELVKHPETVYD